jgi:uncharacterized protein YdeI (YjbR/CyaY-like superfamily)
MTPDDVTHFATPEDFRAWLEEHHDSRDVLWVGYWKKSTGRPSITWPESVDEALCFGWIDGLRKKVDEEAYTIRFTPRREGSIWSKRNIERIEALKEEGRVAAPGLEAYARRTEDNSGVYSFERDEPAQLAPAFRHRLESDPAARAYWEAAPPGYRRTVTHWVMSAKRQATRERRFRALLDDSAAGRKVKPLRRSGE